jgi:putative transcriptional regulator
MSELAPGLLIAAPPLGDPNFERSVVLLASHDEEGAFGWVLNGRMLMSVSELLLRADVTERRIKVPGLVRFGGPVSQDQIWLVYPEAERLAGIDGQFDVAGGIVATASRTVLERIANGAAAIPRILGFAGYAGWGSGQLEGEIRVGSWLPSDVDPSLVFEEPVEELWERAYRRLGTTPIAFTSRTVGSA